VLAVTVIFPAFELKFVVALFDATASAVVVEPKTPLVASYAANEFPP
jgi:hypothetical protein